VDVTSEVDAQARLATKLAPTIHAWFDRIQELPGIALGSSLALDDAELPGADVSFLVWNSILQATDNLKCLVQQIVEHKLLYITALDSLLRTALVSAVQAVWVLHPPERVRRQYRALLVFDDDWRNRKQILEQIRKHSVLPPEIYKEDEERIAQNRAHAKDWIEQKMPNAAARGELERYEVTKIIEQVSPVVFTDDTSRDPYSRFGLFYSWKELSGAIHATPSSILERIDRKELIDVGGGRLHGRATANLATIVMHLSAIVLVLNEAWRLFELRRAANSLHQTPMIGAWMGSSLCRHGSDL
jgi:hypothetical protein